MPEDQILTEKELTEALKELPGWEVRDKWLRKSYKTPGWTHTILLVNTIGMIAEAAWHHPDMNIGYAHVTVKIQTHRVLDVTHSDVELAKRIEEVATWLPSEESPLQGFPKKWYR